MTSLCESFIFFSTPMDGMITEVYSPEENSLLEISLHNNAVAWFSFAHILKSFIHFGHFC